MGARSERGQLAGVLQKADSATLRQTAPTSPLKNKRGGGGGGAIEDGLRSVLAAEAMSDLLIFALAATERAVEWVYSPGSVGVTSLGSTKYWAQIAAFVAL
eukprot:scaffold31597_cov112-Isochrysis_galbana.AAC.2